MGTPASADPISQSVLIVDDEPDVRSLLSDILVEKGFSIHTAVDGVEALASLVDLHPDIVLLDVDMPRLRGVETLAVIKLLAPTTRVIVISGKADAEEARRALALGAFDYIAKPFDLAYLDQALHIAALSG